MVGNMTKLVKETDVELNDPQNAHLFAGRGEKKDKMLQLLGTYNNIVGTDFKKIRNVTPDDTTLSQSASDMKKEAMDLIEKVVANEGDFVAFANNGRIEKVSD